MLRLLEITTISIIKGEKVGKTRYHCPSHLCDMWHTSLFHGPEKAVSLHSVFWKGTTLKLVFHACGILSRAVESVGLA